MDQITEITEAMHPVQVQEDCLIIQEGDIGSKVYVMEGNTYKYYSQRVKIYAFTSFMSYLTYIFLPSTCKGTTSLQTKLWLYWGSKNIKNWVTKT